MLTTSKIHDLHDDIQHGLPFPMSLEDLLDLASRVCPADAFIDDEFFSSLVDVDVTDFTEQVTLGLSGAIRVDPQLMLYELLFMLRNMLQAGLVQIDPDTNKFRVISEIYEDGSVHLEDVYGSG